MSVFFKNLKFEIFEKLTRTRKPYDYLLIIYMKKFTEELNDLKGRTEKNIFLFAKAITRQ